LNSGPGGVAGAYIHERFSTDKEFPRLAGWWGYSKEARFKMEKGFDPIPTAEGWQVSNAPILSMAAHKASLDIFDEAGMELLVEKSRKLTAYLFYILELTNKDLRENSVKVITPENENERGCQVSMFVNKNARLIFESLLKQGIVADWREPNVIRVAPVPLYNSFEEVWRFGSMLKKTLQG
jgi:kynureninase